MNHFTVEKSKPFYDQIYHAIREMIVFNKLKPGERIYEARMARQFDTSRSPVREAVKALIKEGLLVYDEKSRIFVFEPTLDDIVQIYQCRMALESFAARLTAERASAADIEAVGHIIQETERNLLDEESNREKLIHLNTEFHRLIIHHSGNQLLKKQLSEINSLSYYFRTLNFKGKNRGRELYEEHKEIYQYLKQGESQKAADAMMNHIGNDLIHFKAIYGSTLTNHTLGDMINET